MENKPINNHVKAFPSTCDTAHNASVVTDPGMSLLDYFAARAMQTIIPINKNWVTPEGFVESRYYTYMAEQSYAIAQAMLREREKHIK